MVNKKPGASTPHKEPSKAAPSKDHGAEPRKADDQHQKHQPQHHTEKR